MPKKKKGNYKKKKGDTVKRELITKTHLEEYAKISKLLGNKRVTAIFPDQKKILARIPGRFKRCRMMPDDIVLVSYREFEDNKYDIIHKYNIDEVTKLFKQDEIPQFFLDSGHSCEDSNMKSDIIFGVDEGDEGGGFDFENI